MCDYFQTSGACLGQVRKELGGKSVHKAEDGSKTTKMERKQRFKKGYLR